jgi:hypothetical protein
MDEVKDEVKEIVNDENPQVDVAEAIKKFREEFTERSFAGRNVELGKMINCKVCGLRHRSSHECEQRIVTPAPHNTRKGIYGAQAFAKKRIKSHHSARMLQLVQLTQDIFDKYYPKQIADAEKAMQAARGEALQILRRKSHTKSRAKQKQQKKSRRINRSR